MHMKDILHCTEPQRQSRLCRPQTTGSHVTVLATLVTFLTFISSSTALRIKISSLMDGGLKSPQGELACGQIILEREQIAGGMYNTVVRKAEKGNVKKISSKNV